MDAQRVTRKSSRLVNEASYADVHNTRSFAVSLMVLTLDPTLVLPVTLILRTENNRGLNVETSVVTREP